MAKKVVVLGAGFSGLKATRTLSKQLKDDVEITLIDRHSYHTMMTQLHEVAAGRVPFTNAQYDLARLLGHKKNVKLVTDEISSVDKEAKIVKTKGGSYAFDYLIVALGAEPADFGVPGVKEYSYTLWSIEDALRLKRHLEEIVQKASTELDPDKRAAMLNISVAGSGFTGIEMMGELIEWRDVTAREWKLEPEDITLNIVEMMPTILNTLDRKQADKAMKYMKKKGVNFLMNHGITEIGADFIKVNVGGRDEEKVPQEIKTHTLIWTTGVQGNTAAEPIGLAETERGHRLQANEYMEAIGYEDKGIYVAGDVSGYIAPDANGRPTPQIVEAAEQTGKTAASNIIAAIKGGEKTKFVGKYSGTMVSVGGRWGVAAIGKSPLRLTGFWGMLMKNFIFIIYGLEIGSLWYFFTYLQNEIFHTPHDRNLGRGHFSRMANVLWSFPLRLFYGLMWLLDAWPKVFGNADQSWMGKTLKISTFLQTAGVKPGHMANGTISGWIPTTATGGKLTAAAAGASASAGGVKSPTSIGVVGGKFVSNLYGNEAGIGYSGHHLSAAQIQAFMGNFKAGTPQYNSALKGLGISQNSMSLNYDFNHLPGQIFPGTPGFLQPIMKIFVPNFGVALFLQKVMSIVELLLALAILVGAFTWIASAATAGLTLMFASTGMLTWAGLWYIPVAIALMCGAGRALGLDKWIMPWIQKHFFHAWYAKWSSIYPTK